jgi:uncharacterized iron-regulated membrane protein
MPSVRIDRLQRLWRNIHLCIGAGLLILLVPIAISGALLVWKDPLDALIHPSRYAVTAGPAQAPSVYIARAVDAGFEPIAVRFPDGVGRPVVVNARRGGGERDENERGARPSLFMIYIDPPSGRVLDVVDFRTSLFGLIHRFHENLTIPEYFGRSIVGWVGVGMLTSVLTGLYLWWPRNGPIWRGFRWQRGSSVLSNLHHMVGIWIALPLAAVAFTGIYLGFPQQARGLLSSIAAMNPPQRGGLGAPLLQPTARTIDQALDDAFALVPGAKAAAIFLPNRQQKAWRIELQDRGMDEARTVMVNDVTGAVSRAGHELAGDRIAARIRWIHEGSHAGLLWRVLVFLCGLFPPVLGLTGVIIWLQRRSIGRSPKVRRLAARLGPAE